MNKTFKKQNITSDILSGLTAAMLIGSYSLCTSAVSGLGLWNVFFCVTVCALFSLKLKNKVFSPDVFLLMPVLFVISEGGANLLPFCVAGGVSVFLILRKVLPDFKIPDCVIAGGGLGLALVATIILTNRYFGIGAFGSTAFEMLKTYRSLGFHPNFRGLLYGTITLFAMITYPFKFRKLNKYLPAEFMTLLVPLILNLFLNPQQELTTVNEITTFITPFSDNIFLFDFSKDITAPQISAAISGAIALGFILFSYSRKDEKTSSLANITSGILSGFPVRKFEIRSFSLISAVIAIGVSAIVIFLFPDVLGRIPMHCVGALLIVSAWQQVPYKFISSSFKKNGIIALLVIILIVVSFVLLDIFTATVICLLITFLMRRAKK